MSHLFASGSQNIGASASASVFPVNIELNSFRIDWFDLFAVQGTLKSPLQHHSSKASIVRHSALFYCPALTSIHDYWKNHSFDYTNFCWQSNVSAFLICCLGWFLKRQRNQRSNCQHPLDHRKSKRVPEKYLFLLY